MEGHASWSRFCPVFIRKCDEMNGRLMENVMPYFPTDEPWMHTMKPLKSTYYLPPQPLPPPPTTCRSGHPSDAPRGHYRQSTLQFLQVQWRLLMDSHPANPANPANPPPVALERAADAPPPTANTNGTRHGRERSRSRSWGDANVMNENELPNIPFV